MTIPQPAMQPRPRIVLLLHSQAFEMPVVWGSLADRPSEDARPEVESPSSDAGLGAQEQIDLHCRVAPLEPKISMMSDTPHNEVGSHRSLLDVVTARVEEQLRAFRSHTARG